MKHQTAQQIDEMTGPEAQALAERLAVQLCGSDRFKTDLATRLGYSRPAVNGWFAEGGRPPAIASRCRGLAGNPERRAGRSQAIPRGSLTPFQLYDLTRRGWLSRRGVCFPASCAWTLRLSYPAFQQLCAVPKPS